MSTTITVAFISQFESEVHLAYQRQGSKLRGTVRTKNGLVGKDTTFQIAAKGSATQKSRHGDVPPMNQVHTNVTVTLEDWYAGDYVDNLDELKINIDERNIIAASGAWALGRKTDDLITAAMDGTTNAVASSSAALTKAKVLATLEDFGENDVPDDGRWWVVGAQQWTDLLGISEFVNSDFIGMDALPFKGGMTAKSWLGFTWCMHSGLPTSGADRKTFAWHPSSMGHAIGADVQTDITWQGEKQAHFIVNRMSQGAVLIDNAGVREVACTES